MATVEVLMSLPSTLLGLLVDGKQEKERKGKALVYFQIFKLEHVFVHVRETKEGKRSTCWHPTLGEGYGTCSFSEF